MLTIEWGGRPLVLLPQKAAFLPRERILLVADAHIGKAVSFRRLGVPVPRGTTGETLHVLSHLVAATEAAEVVFLGDFLHSRRAHASGTLAAVHDWRARHPALRLTLVRGNHDDRAGDPPAALGFEVVDEPLRRAGWAFAHHPRPLPGTPTLCGHLHPCVVLGRGLDRVRLPCFAVDDALLVLPAFGAFTGMHPIAREPGRQLYAVADDRVVGPV